MSLVIEVMHSKVTGSPEIDDESKEVKITPILIL